MDPSSVQQILTVLQVIAATLDSLGTPGLILLWLSAPALMGIIILGAWIWSTRHHDKEAKEYRETVDKLLKEIEEKRERHEKEQEEKREDYEKKQKECGDNLKAQEQRHYEAVMEILKQYGEAVTRIGGYYNDNVELVKQFERMANGFQDLVVENTKALERIGNQVSNNMFCPMAREAARGGK